MTLLEIVNKVLLRLREDTVSSVNETPYSQLIVEFINVTKREVEDAWNWNALSSTVIINTLNGIATYSLDGVKPRSKIIDISNDTTNEFLQYRPSSWFTKQYLVNTGANSVPKNYSINGLDENENFQLDLYPIPNDVYTINVNVWKPQEDLVDDTDVILVPSKIVIEGTLSRAISERGDDGGNVEQETKYIQILGDYIAIEANMREDEITWGAV